MSPICLKVYFHDTKCKHNSESETVHHIVVSLQHRAPSLEEACEYGLLDGNLGQMASFQDTCKSTLRIEVAVWPEIRQAVHPGPVQLEPGASTHLPP